MKPDNQFKEILKLLNQKGEEVFESKKNFHTWLNHYCIALATKPKNLLKTKEGIADLIDELHRIEYGIFS